MSETKRIGTIGELAVAQALIRQGFEVFIAIGDYSKADLVACRANAIVRLQVKTVSTSQEGVVGCCDHKTTGRKKVKYVKGDFDVLAIFVLDRGKIAYVPIEIILEKGTMSLRLDATKNHQEKNVTWFKDFEVLEVPT